MIHFSKLLNGAAQPGDALRYPAEARNVRPVVVWNCTRRCNLRCAHCYAASDAQAGTDELTTVEAKAFLDDLAAFGAAVVLLSGGEPLLRDDLFELLTHAAGRGLRCVLSTNGTNIDADAARRLAAAGVAYVGVSLDAATPALHDRFRGRDGAYAAALAGLRHAQAAGLRVGLRFTMTRDNLDEIDGVFDLLTREGIGRVCFYHLVPIGRGGSLQEVLVSPARQREAVERIFDRTREMQRAGQGVEVLTVGNHVDGPLAYLRLLRDDPDRARRAYDLLRRNGGNRSGQAIACVGWDGSVHPDQFWRTQTLGNVRTTPFSQLWSQPKPTGLLSQLRNRRPLLPSRCRRCRFLDTCNGNLRARAESAGNGPWGDDPGCYLRDDEIRPEAD